MTNSKSNINKKEETAIIIVSKTILTRENYPLWARKNQTTLIKEDIWKYISDEKDSKEDEKIVAMSVITKPLDDNIKMDFIEYEWLAFVVLLFAHTTPKFDLFIRTRAPGLLGTLLNPEQPDPT